MDWSNYINFNHTKFNIKKVVTEKMGETTIQIVRELLRDDPTCRSNDTWLMIQTFRKLGVKIFIDYKELKNLPALETITKSRRKIQNEENKYHGEGDEFIPEENVTYEPLKES